MIDNDSPVELRYFLEEEKCALHAMSFAYLELVVGCIMLGAGLSVVY